MISVCLVCVCRVHVCCSGPHAVAVTMARCGGGHVDRAVCRVNQFELASDKQNTSFQPR